jgi:hypothetical protein
MSRGLPPSSTGLILISGFYMTGFLTGIITPNETCHGGSIFKHLTYQENSKMNTTGKIITAAAIGAAVGAIIGILVAPEKGSETRQKLCDKGKEFADEIKEAVTRGKDKFSSLKEDIEDLIGSKKEKTA